MKLLHNTYCTYLTGHALEAAQRQGEGTTAGAQENEGSGGEAANTTYCRSLYGVQRDQVPHETRWYRWQPSRGDDPGLSEQ